MRAETDKTGLAASDVDLTPYGNRREKLEQINFETGGHPLEPPVVKGCGPEHHCQLSELKSSPEPLEVHLAKLRARRRSELNNHDEPAI